MKLWSRLIEMVKFNGVDPQTSFFDVPYRIPSKRIAAVELHRRC